MSVEIETSALSMFESIDSLRSTPLVMHRIQIELRNVKDWYAVIRELNQVLGPKLLLQPKKNKEDDLGRLRRHQHWRTVHDRV